MYFKLSILTSLLALCQAGYIEDNHGQAVSSQSITHNSQSNLHGSHLAPVYEHDSILQHSGPVIDQAAYLQHNVALVQAAPVIQRLSQAAFQTPAVQYKAPLNIAYEEHSQDLAPAKYEFSYSVEDPHTSDHKSQHESREGDVVKGEYSLLQPDGSIRKVEYTADDHNGFNAVVHNSEPNPHAAPPSPAPTATRANHVVQAAPLVHAVPLGLSAPLVHSAPVVHSAPLVHSAPVVHAAPVLHAAPSVHAAPTHFFAAHH